MQAIQGKVRRSGSLVDPHDVLQEVFLNIYRYPHRFIAEKADSFRNWGHRIVRNTLLKFLKGQSRVSRFASLDDEIGDREDQQCARSPYRSALESESAGIVDRAYLLYLDLYLLALQPTLREGAARSHPGRGRGGFLQGGRRRISGFRLENLKMVIFRGRRKIFRGLNRTLEDLTSCAPSLRCPLIPSDCQ